LSTTGSVDGAETHAGVFFRPPANVAAQSPQFAVASDYPENSGSRSKKPSESLLQCNADVVPV
jgi:hypothetical protein